MTGAPTGSRRFGRIATGAAALALLGGGTAIGVGLWGNPPPPRPPAAVGAPLATASPSPAAVAAVPTPPPAPPTLPASNPVRLVIPSIQVDTSLMQLGLKADGTIEVPPLDKDAPAGWYRDSPTPGGLGPSVILGHVDTYKAGPVVFYRLGDMRPSDQVSVTREDGTVAEFSVDRVESVPKDRFPQLEVYGNTKDAELRLITCGGDWNPAAHDYADNVVVFAHLTNGR